MASEVIAQAEESSVNYLNNGHTVKSWLLTLDHKRIGLLYLFSISAFFFIGGIYATLIRLELVTPRAFTTRFAAALAVPPESLQVDTPLRLDSWRVLVSHAGRPIHTNEVAAELGVTREHLSRAFGAAGAPNLKRVIDLVRLAAAAELSKNPGYDVGDVARVLGFASSSHLSTTSQRIVGIRPSSLARLRTVDLFERFAHGRMRSRPVVRGRRG